MAPVGADLNTLKNQIVLLMAGGRSVNPYRLKLRSLKLVGDRYVASLGQWLSDESGRSHSRPALIFDRDPRVSSRGRYLAYFRVGEETGLNHIFVVRHIIGLSPGRDPEVPFRYRTIRFDNIWLQTRNGPAVAPYKDDFALVFRKNEIAVAPEHRNQAEVRLFASGEFATGPADFDDIGFIANEGLRRIATVRP